MTEQTYAPNGHTPGYAPAAPVPAALPDWERKRDSDLDEITDAFGPCIPYGPGRVMSVYPAEASAMLMLLWQQDPGRFARLRHQANGGNPADLDTPRQARNRNRRPAG
jgi:hypothetical protein